RALTRIAKPIPDFDGYKGLMDDLYFLFREGVGQRLGTVLPDSFADINTLRTEMRHDIDHGDTGKIRAKRRKISEAFVKYAGTKTAETMEPSRFVLAQANLMTAIEADLKALIATMS